MNTSAPWRRKLAALLTLPLLLLMAGCEIRVNADISGEGELTLTVGFVDTDGMFESLGMTCAEIFEDEEDMLGEEFGEFTQTTIDGHMACMATMEERMGVDGQTLIDNGDSYTFVMEGLGAALGVDDEDTSDLADAMGFVFAVTMPGGIVEYTDGGALAGNTVTYSEVDSLESTIIVTGLKSGEAGEARVLGIGEGSSMGNGAGERSTRQSPSAEASSAPSTDSASPLSSEGAGAGGSLDDSDVDDVGEEASEGVGAGVWVALGLVGAGLLVALSAFASRRSRARA